MESYMMVELIQKKKEGLALSSEEWQFFVHGVTEDQIPDYQTSAMLMAIYFQGLDRNETYALTKAMLESGDVIDLSALPGIKVDKHSTGGVGDKTSLIVGPIAAACGITVAKMSGRGLGFTGGTVDKLESIPGFQIQLSEQAFIDAVRLSGMAIIGQTGDIAPADKKLYALRDVTATVDNVSLIAASIMSKKLASGSDAIVLDVKCGSGAFMKTDKQAAELAAMMVDIGKDAGKTTIALVTDMDQPLGCAVGNTLEVIEACETLRGRGPEDLKELCLTLASYMIFAGGRAEDPTAGYEMAQHALASGEAYQKMKAFVLAQGGNPHVLEDYTGFKKARYSAICTSKMSGYVSSIEADRIGLASLHLGAGRRTKEDTIDISAGLLLKKKVGDLIGEGETLAVLYADDPGKLEQGLREAENAYIISEQEPQRRALVHAVLQ